MDQVSGPVIATALVLSAVFIPTAFISGISGQFYRQFALTIAVSTVISAFNSLTLSPALGALLLQPHGARRDWLGRVLDRFLGWFFRGFNRAFDKTTASYQRLVSRLLRVTALVLLVYLGLIGLTYVGFTRVPTGFIPQQDQRYLVVYAQLPDAASLERTETVIRRVTESVLKTPGLANTVGLIGWSVLTGTSQSNAGTIFAVLEPFEDAVRTQSAMPMPSRRPWGGALPGSRTPMSQYFRHHPCAG
jgi:multidrug efflux pump subunit AcrB